jgi:hypothetical protein
MARGRHWGVVSTVALGLAASTTLAAGCRGCPKAPEGGGGDADASASATPPSPAEAQGDGDTFFGDAGLRFRDAEPQITRKLGEDAGADDAPPDPACASAEIDFASAVVDARCAIGSGRAKRLRATLERDGGALPLSQQAKMSPDGVVTLRLVNTGKAPLALPLSFHPKLPTFTVLAEDEKRAIYELAPPRFEVPAADAGGDRARFARIVLPPGGVATATLTVTPTAVRRVAPACADGGSDGRSDGGVGGGACSPGRLPNGRYTLYVGELLTDVEAGPPARVPWELR